MIQDGGPHGPATVKGVYQMKCLTRAFAALRDPRVRRVLLWKTRRYMMVGVAIIETVLRDSTEVIVAAA